MIPEFITKKRMIKKCLILLGLSFNLLFVKQNQAAVTAYLTHAVFEDPEQGPYLETYLSVIGSSLKSIKNQHANYQSAVEIGIRFIQNEQIITAKKYILNSPESADSVNLPNFIDQQRFVLPNGSYLLEVNILDKNDAKQLPYIIKENIQLNIPSGKVVISDIQHLESYTKSVKPGVLTKSGYDLIPYVSSFYPENINRLKFYAEVYHTKKLLGEDQKILISYFIESAEKHLKNVAYASFVKPYTSEVNVVIGEFNMEDLPTGNYNLVLEVRDKENKLLADQRSFFQRKNKEIPLNKEKIQSIDVSNSFVSQYRNLDTLSDFVRSLWPISSSSEIQFAENLLKEPKPELLQQYFYNFWNSRDAVNPYEAWATYHKEVIKVNKEFGTFGLRGYDTDRGRVYLQYGPPDSRNAVTNETSAYPYEIWQYNTLVNKSLLLNNPGNRQSNKRFVFYNPDLVSNRYTLIHSDARGEILNTRWQLLLNKRSATSNNFDDEKVEDNFGGNVNDNYINPK
jgi:GWxTD domain-containing protein